MKTGSVLQGESSDADVGSSIPTPDASLTLASGDLELSVNVPGAPGTYCGSRFSWAGIISQVKCNGRRFFGPWRPGEYSLDMHDNVTGTAGEFGMGIADMPAPLGFNDASAGGDFVKIGVGVLRREDELPYSFGRGYRLVDSPAWQVRRFDQGVDMTQVLTHGAYGYDYCHRIELVPGSRSFITRHSLTNIGRNEIHQTHYSHNFLVIDQHPVGSGYEVIFPFVPGNCIDKGGITYVEGRSLKFRGQIPAGKAIFAQLSGYGGTASDNMVTVRNGNAGADVVITGDRPVVRYHFFAVAGAVCPEPFVDIRAAPGETVTWQHRYDLSFGREACRG